ncbi:MAG: sulfotransferase [Rhodobiaceae bacterium]|nr:sulfotransferase [Rhodobiaceae bacterium]
MERLPARHFILTLGRSGSNFFVNALNQHPQVFNFGEVLGEWMVVRKMQRRAFFMPKDDAGYLDYMYKSRLMLFGAQLNKKRQAARGGAPYVWKPRAEIRSVGIKDFSLNLIEFGLQSYLADRPDIKVICLRRTHVFERALSYIMLKATGVVSTVGGKPAKSDKTVTIDPQTLHTILSNVARENDELAEMAGALAPDRVLDIEYETYFGRPETQEATNVALFEFLGVPPIAVKQAHRKIITKKPSEIIENYDECRAFLSGTPFADYFE